MERQLIALIEHLFIFTDDMTRGHCGYGAREEGEWMEMEVVHHALMSNGSLTSQLASHSQGRF